MTELLSINGEILVYALIGVLVVFLLWCIRLEIKLRRLLSGKNAKSLEDTIVHIREGHDKLHSFRKEVERYLELVEERLLKGSVGQFTDLLAIDIQNCQQALVTGRVGQ